MIATAVQELYAQGLSQQRWEIILLGKPEV